MSQRIDLITPFPELVEVFVNTSILGRAAEKGSVSYHIHNLFDYADPPHFKIDDEPFGGGAGMILKAEPIFRVFDGIRESVGDTSASMVMFPTPDARQFDQAAARTLSESTHLVFLCGHYKGVDQRVRDVLITHEYSVGDFVVTGGELPALLMLDAAVRLREGVLNTIESAETDSYSSDLLDGPHYTRPREFRGATVPDILISGHHGRIAEWKLEQRKEKTREIRPDLWEKYLIKEQN